MLILSGKQSRIVPWEARLNRVRTLSRTESTVAGPNACSTIDELTHMLKQYCKLLFRVYCSFALINKIYPDLHEDRVITIRSG